MTGVTAAEVAEKYAALLAEGNALLADADALLIRSALEEAAAEIRQQAADLEARITEAEPELATVRAEHARLRTELAECLSRAGSIQAATADDDLTTRVTARSLRLAFEEEATALQARVDGAEAEARRWDDTIGQAAAEIETCSAKLADLAAAIASPFTHPRAQDTLAYSWRVWSGRTMPLLSLGLTDHPEYDDAFSFMLHLVKATGFGAEHERRIEQGVRDRFADVHNLDGVPWRGQALATPEQVQRRSGGKPLVPPLGPAMGVDLAVARQQGIPGVKPSDAGMI